MEGDEVDYLLSLYRRGEMSYLDLCTQVNKMFYGKRLQEIYKDLDEVPLRKNIEKTVSAIKGDGLKVIILSDVPTAVTRYFERYGFQDFLGPEVEIEDGKITEKVHYPGNKFEELERYCKEHKIPLEKCIHVGDSWRDAPVFEKVGLGIALNPKESEISKKADITLFTDDLSLVYEKIRESLKSK